MEKFKKIELKEINENTFKLIGTDWMLITAGTIDNFNTMTASWGCLGMLWNRHIAICFIRPQRHTYNFANVNDYYTLSFFNNEYRNILNYCGTHSGRDADKIKETGLIPAETEHGNIFYEQAQLILECKKLYADDFKFENFISQEVLAGIYPGEDYHRFFIGEIINCYKSQ